MDPNSVASYYIKNDKEFLGEYGHQKLLQGLKKFIQITPDEINKQIIGIDVGSNIGNYLENIETICKNNKILAFEPNPINISVLENKIKSNDNIQLFTCCLSNINQKGKFFNFKYSANNNVGNGLAGLRSGGSYICDVDIHRLDYILDNLNIKDLMIKFIKIDTEGNDTNVIKGMGKYLSQTKYIIFECSDCLDDFRGPNIKNPMKDIVDYLDDHGFDTYRIGTKKLIKVNGDYWNTNYELKKFWSNCFAIKKGDILVNKLIDENFNYLY